MSMKFFMFDASGLAKRYSIEIGTNLLNLIFTQVGPDRLSCLMIGVAEVISALVRKKNVGLVSAADFTFAVLRVRVEILDSTNFQKLQAPNVTIEMSLPYLEKYSVNATDALFLQVAVDLANQSRSAGHDLVVVASDQRLLKAAQAENLLTFDPETQSQAELNVLLAP